MTERCRGLCLRHDKNFAFRKTKTHLVRSAGSKPCILLNGLGKRQEWFRSG